MINCKWFIILALFLLYALIVFRYVQKKPIEKRNLAQAQELELISTDMTLPTAQEEVET